jgi:hypothetical protein
MAMERKRKTRASRSERCKERDGDEAAENECEADATKKDGGGRMRPGRAGQDGRERRVSRSSSALAVRGSWAGLACCWSPNRRGPHERSWRGKLHSSRHPGHGMLANEKRAFSPSTAGAFRVPALAPDQTGLSSRACPIRMHVRSDPPAPPAASFQAGQDSGVDYPISCDFLPAEVCASLSEI